jgi:hypothetical protein
MQRNYLKIALRNLSKNKVYSSINYLNNTKNLNNMKKKFLSSGFVLAGVCLFAFFSVNAQSDNAVTNTSQVYKINGKTGINGSTHTFVDGKEYDITVKNGVVTKLYINGNKIPAEKIVDYKTVLDKIYYSFRTDHEQTMGESKQAMRDSEINLRIASLSPIAPIEPIVPIAKLSPIEDLDLIDKRIDEIFEELISEQIIKNRKELKLFKLSDNELIVNGIKQSAVLHKRLRDKYLTNKSDTIVYNIK